MNSLGKHFFVIVAVVLTCATPAMANQPPGPGVSLPQILMLPLMALFTALGGGYSILGSERKYRFGKWVAIVVLFIFGFTHEGASLLVACLFGAVAIHRGVRMIKWGLKPVASGTERSSVVPGWRLISAGAMLSVVALYLMGSAVVFVNYWPDIYQRGQVSQLKRLLASEIAYGRAQKQQTGKTRFYRIEPGDDSERYTQELLRHGNVRVDFNPDEKHFTVYLLPYSKFPPWPYRFWTKQNSYRADETGQIRMILVRRRDEVCPADAPVVMKVGEEDIREITMSTNWQKRMLAAHALRSGQPLQSIPFAAVVVAGVDRRDSALLLSFIVCELWYGCCFLLAQSFVFPKKIVPVVSRSPDEAEIGPVFVF